MRLRETEGTQRWTQSFQTGDIKRPLGEKRTSWDTHLLKVPASGRTTSLPVFNIGRVTFVVVQKPLANHALHKVRLLGGTSEAGKGRKKAGVEPKDDRKRKLNRTRRVWPPQEKRTACRTEERTGKMQRRKSPLRKVLWAESALLLPEKKRRHRLEEGFQENVGGEEISG